MDTYKVLMTVIAILSISFNIYQYVRKKPRFRLQMSYNMEINEDGEGLYLAAKLFISNIGGEPAIYNGLEAHDSKGKLFYPSSTGKSGTRIDPNDSIVVAIPNGHLLSGGTLKLSMIDGVFKKHYVPKGVLTKLMIELAKEKERLENRGVKVHPPTLFERHKKSSKKNGLTRVSS